MLSWWNRDATRTGLGIPKSGMIVPKMGRIVARSSLTDALLTPVQQRVLGLLFGQPERHFQNAELIRLAKDGTDAVHRQLARLATVGLGHAQRKPETLPDEPGVAVP